MAKPKMVICKYCKTKIDKNTAYIEDYLTDTGVLRNNYYCNVKVLEHILIGAENALFTLDGRNIPVVSIVSISVIKLNNACRTGICPVITSIINLETSCLSFIQKFYNKILNLINFCYYFWTF